MRIKETVLNTVGSINGKINQGQERSVKAKKNIIGAFFLKGTSIAISIVMVPLAINYVSVSQYGIWLTLSSIVVWFSFFDIGLTQGLRNKFAEAVAKGNHELAQVYVSTTYAILGIICGVIWLVFLFVNQYLNWPGILNSPSSMHRELSILALMVFTYFCLNFVLKILNILLMANQQPALSSLLSLFGQIFSLVCIFILIHTTEGSLLYLGAVFCFSPVVILLIAHAFFFRGNYKKYRPTISKVQFPYAKSLFNLGIVFFVIQVAGLVQYQTANIIIARQFSTADVTQYNIVYKYFGMTKMGYSIFLLPFWSACTEAFLKNDIVWIKKSIRKYKQLIFILFLVGCIMLIFSSRIYDIWLGKGKVNIGFYLSLWGFIYFLSTMIADTYVSFLNGINALRIQFIACIVSPLVFIGVAFLLLKYFKLGVYSLFIASVICNFNGLILAPLQYHMIINKKKKGIWIR
jgi:O-antigen/teichoic acid export membrane protein